jgi:hypothetical protein
LGARLDIDTKEGHLLEVLLLVSGFCVIKASALTNLGLLLLVYFISKLFQKLEVSYVADVADSTRD